MHWAIFFRGQGIKYWSKGDNKGWEHLLITDLWFFLNNGWLTADKTAWICTLLGNLYNARNLQHVWLTGGLLKSATQALWFILHNVTDYLHTIYFIHMHTDQLAPSCSYSTSVFEGAKHYWYKQRYIPQILWKLWINCFVWYFILISF